MRTGRLLQRRIFLWPLRLMALGFAILIAMAGEAECEPGGCCSGVYFYGHCDCWLYDDGDSSRKQYHRNLQKFQVGSTAPAQQTMQPAGATEGGTDAADE